MPLWEYSPPLILPRDEELLSFLDSFILSKNPQTLSEDEKKLATLGRKFFFDTKFSANQKVSCATCHDPKFSFSDNKAKAKGLGDSHRKTPALINPKNLQWLFWDGRALSLEEQAKGPIEHPMEHGISRTKVGHLILGSYLKEYNELFPSFQKNIFEKLPQEAAPENFPENLPLKLSAFSLASIKNLFYMNKILKDAEKNGQPPALEINRRINTTPELPIEWTNNWKKFSNTEQEVINEVFDNFAKAIAAYERTIYLEDSSFDKFTARFKDSKNSSTALSNDFSKEALLGLKLFMAPGKCTICHRGSDFSDQMFHNIGLEFKAEDFLDSGRALGLTIAKKNHQNCSVENEKSCKQLKTLDDENFDLVAAFKTPSLRNVGLKTHFMHDGRFDSIRQVLEHYNSAGVNEIFGHREETLQPLNFSSKELEALEAFLKTLTSEVIEGVK